MDDQNNWNPDHPSARAASLSALNSLHLQGQSGFMRTYPQHSPFDNTVKLHTSEGERSMNVPLSSTPSFAEFWPYERQIRSSAYETSMNATIQTQIIPNQIPSSPLHSPMPHSTPESIRTSSPQSISSNKDKPYEEFMEFANAVNSKREFNWAKIRKLSGWMHQITSHTQQKELTEDLQQKLYFSTIALLKYIGDLKDPPEPFVLTSPNNPQYTPVNYNYTPVSVSKPPSPQPQGFFDTPSPATTTETAEKQETSTHQKKKQTAPRIRKTVTVKTSRNLYCYMCGVTETPEWRRGPSGEHTLCNACGLQYAKSIRNLKSQQGQPPPSAKRRKTAKNAASNGSTETPISDSQSAVAQTPQQPQQQEQPSSDAQSTPLQSVGQGTPYAPSPDSTISQSVRNSSTPPHGSALSASSSSSSLLSPDQQTPPSEEDLALHNSVFSFNSNQEQSISQLPVKR